MIIRDLYRCSPEDLQRAIVASGQPVRRRGVIDAASTFGQADIDYLLGHPDFDPSLSFVAYEGAEPVACLVSRIAGPADAAEAIWSFFCSKPAVPGAREQVGDRARETVLDAAMDAWKKEKAKRARNGLTGLIGSELRMAEETAAIDLLKNKGFEVTQLGAEMAVTDPKAPTEAATERENQLRQKGFIVRMAQPDEVAVVARQFHPRRSGGWLSAELWNAIARGLRHDALIVIELRRALIGFGCYYGWTLEGDCPELGPLFIEQVHKSNHLEDILLRHTLAAAKQAGKPRIKLNTTTDRVPYYTRAGFTVTGYFARETVADLT